MATDMGRGENSNVQLPASYFALEQLRSCTENILAMIFSGNCRKNLKK